MIRDRYTRQTIREHYLQPRDPPQKPDQRREAHEEPKDATQRQPENAKAQSTSTLTRRPQSPGLVVAPRKLHGRPVGKPTPPPASPNRLDTAIDAKSQHTTCIGISHLDLEHSRSAPSVSAPSNQLRFRA
jgi:hypothetical protein